jgi:hypothetical protein
MRIARRFYAKGVNCCANLHDEVASACTAATCPANAATLRCADLLTVIGTSESPYPASLKDWTCTAFPNDDLPGDSLIVALIALAIAMPVTIFLSGTFEIANDSEAPESWLRYTGLGRMVCGRLAHRKWHYTGPLGQPPRLARWYIRSADAPMAESFARGALALCRVLFCVPRALLARNRAAAAAPVQPVFDEPRDDTVTQHRHDSLRLSIGTLMNGGTFATLPAVDAPADSEATGNAWASRRRQESLQLSISRLMSVEDEETPGNRGAGLQALGYEAAQSRSLSLQTSMRATADAADLAAAEAADAKAERAYRDSILWAMYSRPVAEDGWDGASSLGSADGAEPSHMDDALRLRRHKRLLTLVGLVGVAAIWAIFAWFILTYGLLCYELLGSGAEDSFTQSWAISYGIGAATEWRDVARQALTAVLILAIAERLHLTRPVSWLEDHVDYMSTSALLLEHGGLSYFQELRLLFTFRRRLSD